MRIVAGRFKGRSLAALGKGDPAAHLRPTTDRVRESLFAILQGGRLGDPLTGARVLDVFAGTGALGLEALSRSAASAAFIENGVRALELLRENIRRCGAEEATELLRRDATRPGPPPGGPYSLVFLDPPYGQGLGEKALAGLIAARWLAPGALVVWEDAAPPDIPAGLELIDQRRLGGSTITFLR